MLITGTAGLKFVDFKLTNVGFDIIHHQNINTAMES